MGLTGNFIKKISSDKQASLVVSIIYFLVLCLIFYFIFLPAFKQSRLLSRQIKEKRLNLTKVKVSTNESSLLEEQISKTKEQLEIIKNRLFWEKDISRLLNELTQLASGLEIEFVSLKPEAVYLPVEKDKKESTDYLLAQVPISVSIRSNYDNLVKFLRKIERADKFIKIDTLNIESDQRNIHRHNIKVSLSIFTRES